MPDENKFTVLDQIGYKIPPCCGLCEHGNFPVNPGPYWGTCGVNQYEHLKHVGPPRQMSIHKFGTCPKFQVNKRKIAHLQSFQKFFSGTEAE